MIVLELLPLGDLRQYLLDLKLKYVYVYVCACDECSCMCTSTCSRMCTSTCSRTCTSTVKFRSTASAQHQTSAMYMCMYCICVVNISDRSNGGLLGRGDCLAVDLLSVVHTSPTSLARLLTFTFCGSTPVIMSC